MKLQYDFLNSKEIKIYFQNIQSLRAHIEDISSDHTIMQSNFICLVETWTFPEESCNIINFSEVSRIDCVEADDERIRKKRGIVILTHLLYKRYFNHSRNTLQIIAMKYKDICLIVIYRNQSFPECTFRTLLSNCIGEIKLQHDGKIIIVGDVNICRRTSQGRTETMLIENGFGSLLEKDTCTTKYETQIDWVFSNGTGDNIICKRYPTIHSHHDGIMIGL